MEEGENIFFNSYVRKYINKIFCAGAKKVIKETNSVRNSNSWRCKKNPENLQYGSCAVFLPEEITDLLRW